MNTGWYTEKKSINSLQVGENKYNFPLRLSNTKRNKKLNYLNGNHQCVGESHPCVDDGSRSGVDGSRPFVDLNHQFVDESHSNANGCHSQAVVYTYKQINDTT